MASIRKIKRRAMARLKDPRIELRCPAPFWDFMSGMTSIERENFIRRGLKAYIKHRAKGE